VYQSLLR